MPTPIIGENKEELEARVKAFQEEIAEVCKKHGFEYFAQLMMRPIREPKE
jgi:hypothetical protein